MGRRPPLPPDQRPNPRKRTKGPSSPKAFDLGAWVTAATGGDADELFINAELDDTNVAIVAVAWFDRFLTWLIVLHIGITPTKSDMDKVFRYPGPLSSFSSKIDLCYLMGHLTKEMRDSLDHIRQIRNTFCHTRKPRTFSDDDIVSHCNKLYLANLKYEQIRSAMDALNAHGPVARRKFVLSTMVLMILLIGFLYRRLGQLKVAMEHKDEISKYATDKIHAMFSRFLNKSPESDQQVAETLLQELIDPASSPEGPPQQSRS